MRKLTNEEIEDLINVEGIDKDVAGNFLRSMTLDIIDAMDSLVQNARMFKWKKATILVVMNGICISAGLPKPDDIEEC